MNVMPFDELNTLKASLPRFFENGRIKSENDLEELLDMLEDLFLLAYADGILSSNMSLSSSYVPTLEEVEQTVNRKIAGKTWRERVLDYYDNGGTIADIERIAETETHRDANAGAYAAALAGGATTKTWNTMLDDRVRDSHAWLEGVTAPIDGEFYNELGQSTYYPGEWGIPEQDCNCRCYLTFS